MDISMFLAKIFGIYLLVAGVSLYANKGGAREVLDDFMSSRGLQMWGGATALLLGLLLVNVHNVWSGSWEIIITLIAWGSLLKGALYMLSPRTMRAVSYGFLKSWTDIWSVVVILAGAWLTYVAYLA